MDELKKIIKLMKDPEATTALARIHMYSVPQGRLAMSGDQRRRQTIAGVLELLHQKGLSDEDIARHVRPHTVPMS